MTFLNIEVTGSVQAMDREKEVDLLPDLRNEKWLAEVRQESEPRPRLDAAAHEPTGDCRPSAVSMWKRFQVQAMSPGDSQRKARLYPSSP